MKVKGLFCKDKFFYYCIVCDEFFDIENPCVHFIDWDVKKIPDDERDCMYDDAVECIVKLNYEVKIINNKKTKRRWGYALHSQ
jgi:hypothetical protein